MGRKPALVILFGVVSLIVSACGSGEHECGLTGPRPMPPTVLGVSSSPVDGTITIVVEDHSDNETWFALERSTIEQVGLQVVVGSTLKPGEETNSLQPDRSRGRQLEIVDRGITPGDLVDGQQYVYRGRAWNCYAASEPSNEIVITARIPS